METIATEEVQLDLEPEPDAKAEGKADIAVEEVPASEAPRDPAAEAFARVEGEIALMRRAVQHLAAERADIVIPDYTPSLAEMTKRLRKMSDAIEAMADHPAMQLTPDSLGRRIEASAEAARRSDHERITTAQSDLRQAAQDMRAVTTHARTAAEQRRTLLQGVGGGMLAGILLWSFLPGTIARAMPESWQWPERMAAGMLGADSLWTAGNRLMQTGSPEAWNALAQTADVLRDNRDAIEACRKSAESANQPVRCTVRISNPRP
jgi:hypothetical protein